MKHCPKCNSLNTVKNGFLRGTQRKRCKDCGYQYTKTFSGRISPDTKRNALELYLEGLGFRSIGRFLGCSHVSVYNWIRSFGTKLEPLKKEIGVEIMEIDEMHTYISSKKTTVGYGLLLIDTERNLSIASLGQGSRNGGATMGGSEDALARKGYDGLSGSLRTDDSKGNTCSFKGGNVHGGRI